MRLVGVSFMVPIKKMGTGIIILLSLCFGFFWLGLSGSSNEKKGSN